MELRNAAIHVIDEFVFYDPEDVKHLECDVGNGLQKLNQTSQQISMVIMNWGRSFNV